VAAARRCLRCGAEVVRLHLGRALYPGSRRRTYMAFSSFSGRRSRPACRLVKARNRVQLYSEPPSLFCLHHPRPESFLFPPAQGPAVEVGPTYRPHPIRREGPRLHGSSSAGIRTPRGRHSQPCGPQKKKKEENPQASRGPPTWLTGVETPRPRGVRSPARPGARSPCFRARKDEIARYCRSPAKAACGLPPGAAVPRWPPPIARRRNAKSAWVLGLSGFNPSSSMSRRSSGQPSRPGCRSRIPTLQAGAGQQRAVALAPDAGHPGPKSGPPAAVHAR